MNVKATPKKAELVRTPALDPDPHVWIKGTGIKTSADVPVPKRLIDQVIGQESAVAVALKAAEQKRHLLLIGDPGTGKSMLAKAMAEVLPREKQHDILVYHNSKNPNNPTIGTYEGGAGRIKIQEIEKKARKYVVAWRVMEWVVAFGLLAFGLWLYFLQGEGVLPLLFCGLIAIFFIYAASQKRPKIDFLVPKLLIEHTKEDQPAPYIDGTGAHAGALLGDVRHDPYQSGGLETPPHVRVEIGAIHRAHKGVLFIDEINVLRLPSQQALLTALQERTFAILGQSQSSAGAMVKSEPVPCDFILVAAGNLDAVRVASEDLSGGMHPALRSRIRGYGYEVFVNSIMDDNLENRTKLLQFVAQEVVRDGKIPHFEAAAIAEVIREGQRRSGQTGKLTLRLRELGGLVRTAGDYARKEQTPFVTVKHVREAKLASRSLEQQITASGIKKRQDRVAGLRPVGLRIGVAMGTASVGTGEVGEPAGLLVPVEAAFTPALSRSTGNIIVGHRLKKITDVGLENVGAALKTFKGAEIASHDLHIDATIHHEDAAAEGSGIAACVAAISALERLPVKQEYAMVGTLAVAGEMRPVEATLQQVEAAMEAGCKFAIVPDSIKSSLLLDDYIREKLQVIFCHNLSEVLEHVLGGDEKKKRRLLDQIRANSQEIEVIKGNGHKATAQIPTGGSN